MLKWTLIATLNFGTPHAHKMIVHNYDSWADCLIGSVHYLAHSASGTAASCMLTYLI